MKFFEHLSGRRKKKFGSEVPDNTIERQASIHMPDRVASLEGYLFAMRLVMKFAKSVIVHEYGFTPDYLRHPQYSQIVNGYRVINQDAIDFLFAQMRDVPLGIDETLDIDLFEEIISLEEARFELASDAGKIDEMLVVFATNPRTHSDSIAGWNIDYSVVQRDGHTMIKKSVTREARVGLLPELLNMPGYSVENNPLAKMFIFWGLFGLLDQVYAGKKDIHHAQVVALGQLAIDNGVTLFTDRVQSNDLASYINMSPELRRLYGMKYKENFALESLRQLELLISLARESELIQGIMAHPYQMVIERLINTFEYGGGYATVQIGPVVKIPGTEPGGEVTQEVLSEEAANELMQLVSLTSDPAWGLLYAYTSSQAMSLLRSAIEQMFGENKGKRVGLNEFTNLIYNFH